MRKHAKNAVDQLHSLGCHLDHDDRELHKDRWVFTHPNAPGETFKISDFSGDAACRNVVRRAKVAAGLATSESGEKRKPRIDARAKAEADAIRLRREALAAARESQRAAQEIARLAEARRRQVTSLDRMMRGVPTTGAAPLPPEAKFSIPQLADELDVSEAAIKRAIDDEVLEAYMCSGVIKVRGADATAWARRRSA
ncbi:hypothetical protein [Nocardioides alcanivorans]|uniref:hypothetical protein n=1 Tax=Nocardioides alcanivorans TaxID=2897352 RepID=UPI001F3CDFD8|nr:hypothetical protein [Nocardioides alcanivorans]